MSEPGDEEHRRPHSPARFRIGIALLVLAGAGVVATFFTDTWVVKLLWACLIPGATTAVYGWRGPDAVHRWPDSG